MLFFFKQKTAYEMRISDWSSDVCSSDLSQRASARLSDRHKNAEGQMPATNATGDERKYWGVIPMMSAPVLSDMTKRMEDIGFEGVTALQIYGLPWPSLSVAATAPSRRLAATGIAVARARNPFRTPWC